METYLVPALYLAALSGIAILVHHGLKGVRQQIDDAVSKVLAELPQRMPVSNLAPVVSAIENLSVKHQFSGTPGAAPGLLANVEIIRKTPDGFTHVGWRVPGSADIAEALTHPDLALRHPDGTIEGAL